MVKGMQMKQEIQSSSLTGKYFKKESSIGKNVEKGLLNILLVELNVAMNCYI